MLWEKTLKGVFQDVNLLWGLRTRNRGSENNLKSSCVGDTDPHHFYRYTSSEQGRIILGSKRQWFWPQPGCKRKPGAVWSRIPNLIHVRLFHICLALPRADISSWGSPAQSDHPKQEPLINHVTLQNPAADVGSHWFRLGFWMHCLCGGSP